MGHSNTTHHLLLSLSAALLINTLHHHTTNTPPSPSYPEVRGLHKPNAPSLPLLLTYLFPSLIIVSVLT